MKAPPRARAPEAGSRIKTPELVAASATEMLRRFEDLAKRLLAVPKKEVSRRLAEVHAKKKRHKESG
jgi:hypothetical protein